MALSPDLGDGDILLGCIFETLEKSDYAGWIVWSRLSKTGEGKSVGICNQGQEFHPEQDRNLRESNDGRNTHDSSAGSCKIPSVRIL